MRLPRGASPSHRLYLHLPVSYCHTDDISDHLKPGCMRELFDEVAGQSPLDPQELVRRATRTPRRKRFYTSAGVAEADGGFSITLDGKPIKTPSGRVVIA